MRVRIVFRDNHTEEYDMTGWGGEPDIPYTFQFETGINDDHKQHNIPLSAIREIEYPALTWR